MSAPAFTPGPWEAITDGDVPDVVFNGGKDSIFYVNGEEGNANARLIAAAPALYEALDGCRLYFEARKEAGVSCHAMLKIIDEALTLALGDKQDD